ncbi:aromatic ring-hydroxylating dioxygenase subunit alpha [Pandoraea sp. PE-S2R-1]|uniref:aromatic ring-hydroxylating dioxygenase subunit alpha n=1 Tax=Pandoraea sp. PE-S2R-1 TaxID=1986994 RepID=UPI001483A314|nr:aromatic ring-hydroxylating dioxygenase subunit alpha [Pandoraea sp. PE-S2R-1]
MYPLKEGQTFPRNQWYIAAWAHEVGRELLARQILGEPLVFYRTESGMPVALDNRCPHRRYPLSKGRLVRDSVQCGYHGLTYDCTGKCTAIPSQDSVPPTYAVRAYPVHQAWEWLWVWMGDPALADIALIPDSRTIKVDDPDWLPEVGGRVPLKARYQLLNENLLDLSHLSFLHSDNIGSAGVATAPVSVEERETHLEVARYIKSDRLDHLPVGKAFGLEGLTDRTMIQKFFAPSFHATGSDFDSAMSGGIDPGRHFGSLRVLHGVTPETATTTHYFWGFSRDFKRDDARMTEAMRSVIESALVQDIEALEEIEAMLAGGEGDIAEISARADAASLRGRRMVERQIENDGPARGAAVLHDMRANATASREPV